MKLTILGSSSSGNCYLLSDGYGSTLIIEAGINAKTIFAALGKGAAKIAGCIISHKHNDHAKYAEELTKRGIKVYALLDVAQAKGITDSINYSPMLPTQMKQIGDYSVIPFSVDHDAECIGFYIYHEECGNIVFITDLHDSSYAFPDVNYFLVEANYAKEMLEANKDLHPAVKARIRNTHCEIGTTESLLMDNDLTKTNKIILIHLSDQNSDASAFQQRIETATGVETVIADAGMVINL